MAQFTTVTRKGQITIPADIRRALGIEEGDKIAVSIAEGQNSVIIVQPVRSVAEVTYGLGAALRPASPGKERPAVEEMREQFETGMAEAAMKPLTRSQS